MADYPRDLRGYGREPPDPQWPGGARIAVQFVVNFEEGGENNILHGDPASEAFLSDVLGAKPWPGQRHANIESMFEYGSRAGFWRLWRIFTERKLPTTVFGVATALKRNPQVVAAMKEAGWDIASHSLRWVEHKDMSEAEERAEIADAILIHTEVTGQRPLTSVWMRIASAISARSSASDMSLCSTHLRLWLAMSQPASFMAATTCGFRFNAVATPNTVVGSLRSVKIRHNRQKPAREPYSNIDSILAWRCPGHGFAPNTSDRNASDA